mmetsp:Transcript_39106/g.116838  ORF Transcript_39106/g.116838 Transcript_39106/m.116838 type:complete len:283 (-) Transcript_39106:10-858(-)
MNNIATDLGPKRSEMERATSLLLPTQTSTSSASPARPRRFRATTAFTGSNSTEMTFKADSCVDAERHLRASAKTIAEYPTYVPSSTTIPSGASEAIRSSSRRLTPPASFRKVRRLAKDSTSRNTSAGSKGNAYIVTWRSSSNSLRLSASLSRGPARRALLKDLRASGRSEGPPAPVRLLPMRSSSRWMIADSTWRRLVPAIVSASSPSLAAAGPKMRQRERTAAPANATLHVGLRATRGKIAKCESTVSALAAWLPCSLAVSMAPRSSCAPEAPGEVRCARA